MKISRQTREIINIVLFFLIAGVLLTAFVIYPLNKTADLYERVNIEEYNADSTAANDATLFLEAGLQADTFRVESDGIATLAVVVLGDSAATDTATRGTILIIPSQHATRDDFVNMSRELIDSGFSVIAMDLRATGRSGGEYHGDGQLEADDLTAVIHFLSLRDYIIEPFTVIGLSLGGDAALLAAHDNDIISSVIAYDPYLTSKRMQVRLKEEHDLYWLLFEKTVMWFWYEIRSGYAPTYRDLEQIEPVPCPTVLLIPEEYQSDEEIVTLTDMSAPDRLKIVGPDREDLSRQILNLVYSQVPAVGNE